MLCEEVYCGHYYLEKGGWGCKPHQGKRLSNGLLTLYIGYIGVCIDVPCILWLVSCISPVMLSTLL